MQACRLGSAGWPSSPAALIMPCWTSSSRRRLPLKTSPGSRPGIMHQVAGCVQQVQCLQSIVHLAGGSRCHAWNAGCEEAGINGQGLYADLVCGHILHVRCVSACLAGGSLCHEWDAGCKEAGINSQGLHADFLCGHVLHVAWVSACLADTVHPDHAKQQRARQAAFPCAEQHSLHTTLRAWT